MKINKNNKIFLKSKLNKEEVKKTIDMENKNLDINFIDFDRVYTFTKKHFLGNVAVDYEYYCEELKLWLYDYELVEEYI